MQALRLSGGRPGLLVMILAALAGVISMFVDNVVVILMMAPVALPLARALKLPVTPLVLMIGFAANFMGSAMLLGDLPPQMLHSVSGAEFGDFFWQLGRPSSFPILMVTFVVTLVAMYLYGFRQHRRQVVDIEALGIETHVPNRLFATVVVAAFLATVLAMAFREAIGFKLGFIAMTGAISLVFILELLGDRVKGAGLRGDPERARLAGDLLLHRAVRAGRWTGKGAPARRPGPAAAAGVRRELRAGRDAHVLGDGADRRHRRARCLHPDLPLHHPRPAGRRRCAVAAVVDDPLVRHAGQQPDGRRRASALFAALNICQKEEDRRVSLREFLRGACRSRSSRRGSATSSAC